MVQGHFYRSEGSEPIRLSGRQFRLVVEAFDGATGDRALGAEPVEQQIAMCSQHAGDFLHRLQPRAHDLLAPAVQEAASPGRGHVLPEELEVLFEQIATNGPQVVAEQIGQLALLSFGQILGPLEQQPARARQDGLVAFGLQILDLCGPNRVDGLAQVSHDVEAVEDVNRLVRLLGDHPQIGFPHVAADELQRLAAFLAEPTKEAQERLDLPVLADPEQPLAVFVDLIDQSQVMVASVPLDLVDAHRLDAAQIDMVASPQDRHLHGAKDAGPTGLKRFGNLLPAQALGPSGQEPGERRRQVVLALRPKERPRRGFRTSDSRFCAGRRRRRP